MEITKKAARTLDVGSRQWRRFDELVDLLGFFTASSVLARK
jgi:hypothetical protein